MNRAKLTTTNPRYTLTTGPTSKPTNQPTNDATTYPTTDPSKYVTDGTNTISNPMTIPTYIPTTNPNGNATIDFTESQQTQHHFIEILFTMSIAFGQQIGSYSKNIV